MHQYIDFEIFDIKIDDREQYLTSVILLDKICAAQNEIICADRVADIFFALLATEHTCYECRAEISLNHG